MRSRALLFLAVSATLSLFAPACSKSSDGTAPSPPASTPPPAPPTPPVAEAAASAVPPDPATTDAAEPHEDVLQTSRGELRIVPIHHGSVLFELAGKAYYVDPFHEGNLDGLPKADIVFITHPHPDHLDPEALEKVKKPSTIYVAPPSVAEKLTDKVIGKRSEGNPIVLKEGDKKNIGGIGVETVAMYNLKRGPSAGKLYHEKGWGEGFVLTFGDKRVYVSGDTECTPEMRALKDIDVAFVCMNLPYTMPPSEAAECIAAFKPKIVYAYHYRGSDLGELDKGLANAKGIEVRKRAWY